MINGVSKNYAMTGWRIGYAAGPADLVAPMGTVQSHSTSNPNSIAQKAALEAISGPQEKVAIMRRDLMLEQMQTIPDVSCPKPQGAFYLFPSWQAYLGPQGRRP